MPPPRPAPVPPPEPPPLVEEAPPPPAPEVKPPPIREPVPEARPRSIAELLPETKPGTIETNPASLSRAFQSDRPAAETQLADKNIRVTGVVDRVMVKDILDIHYIILTSPEKTESWNVRCTFNSQYDAQLKRLTTGQTATVEGKYDGYGKNILFRDCLLITG